MLWRKVLRPEQLLRRAPLFGSEELRGVSDTPGQIRKRAWRTPNSGQQDVSPTYKFALQKKSLTSRYLPRLMDLPTGVLGFNPGLLHALESFGEFGGLIRSLLLQGPYLDMASLSSCWTSPNRASCFRR